MLLGLTQIEKELALRFRRCNFDETPISQHVLMDLGANPMYREGDEPDADGRIESPNRFHQTDVAFLDEVGQL